jgi:hypothetical protein
MIPVVIPVATPIALFSEKTADLRYVRVLPAEFHIRAASPSFS